jgi:hypothetical protein
MSAGKRRRPTVLRHDWPMIQAAFWPRRRKPSVLVAELLRTVGIIVRHGSLAPHLYAIYGHGPHRGVVKDGAVVSYGAVFDAVIAEATKRLLTEERYLSQLPGAITTSVVDRDYTPLIKLVIKAANAARMELFNPEDALRRAGALPARDTTSASTPDTTVAGALRLEQEAAETAQEQSWRAATDDLSAAVADWYQQMTPRQREVLHLLIQSGSSKLSDREIEVLTRADRKRVVAPMRKRFCALVDAHLRELDAKEDRTFDTETERLLALQGFKDQLEQAPDETTKEQIRRQVADQYVDISDMPVPTPSGDSVTPPADSANEPETEAAANAAGRARGGASPWGGSIYKDGSGPRPNPGTYSGSSVGMWGLAAGAERPFREDMTSGPGYVAPKVSLPHGSRVRHPTFGEGVVISGAGSDSLLSVLVNFDDESARWIMAQYLELVALPDPNKDRVDRERVERLRQEARQKAREARVAAKELEMSRRAQRIERAVALQSKSEAELAELRAWAEPLAKELGLDIDQILTSAMRDLPRKTAL